ncbi:MAG: PadR family transcriptional regulator [Actinomycetota bacterium]
MNAKTSDLEALKRHPENQLNSTAASLLGFLVTFGSMSGWDVVSAVEASIGNFWNVTRSQVYRELGRLAELGFVREGDSGPRARRPYTATPSGRRAFVGWLNEEPGPDLIRLPFFLKFFFGRHLEPGKLRGFLETRRADYEKDLEYFRGISAGMAQSEPHMAEVARMGAGYCEAVLAWMDSLDWGRLA